MPIMSETGPGEEDQHHLYRPLMGKATLLLRGDTITADKVVRSSLAAMRDAAGHGRDVPPGWLGQTIVNKIRSILRHRG